MSASATRSEKLDLRLTPEAKKTLGAAAAAASRSVSEFVLESALARAAETLPDRRRFELDPARWKAFQAALDAPPKQVNAAVNASIWLEDDQAHYGRAEYWTIPTDGYGDCEDFALAKRKQLIGVGFPEPALRIAIVITPREARHAVLTVATDKGDYVLDNLSNDVVAWNATGYRWIERQDARRPMAWVSLQPPTMVAANASLPVGGTQPASSIK